ncbi:hypothetical protein [uncultured Gammaproteobacteria bacterium]|nr:hypothetical protein [uncultured Gammaproteobacteria bacterium]
MKNHQKNCLFQNITTIKLAIKAILFPNFNHMGRTNKTLAAATLSAVMATTSPANTETPKNLNQEKITCETKIACQKLSTSIQAQINELEAKANLSKDEKRLRYNLRKQLIVLEKSETAKQQQTITAENQKQTNLDKKSEQNQKTIDDKLKSQSQKLDELRGILLSK